MAKLCIYLPPFASDYSGACSALFDLSCMTAINDAGCCTEHYVFCDEPRWEKQIRPVFCTTIRNIDAVLGNDDIILDNICKAAANISPAMLALVGTPVPAITGMDMDGMACELEARTGLPAIGFATTGFAYYDQGMVRAGTALIDRFAEPADPISGLINLVGLTPLDYGDRGNEAHAAALLEAEGWKIGCRFFMGMTRDQLHDCASASCNLAVSAGGLALARALKKRFGTPYTVGYPITQKQASAMTALHDSVLEEDVLFGSKPIISAPCSSSEPGPRILLITDQILGLSLRDALQEAGLSRPIDVASFFGWDKTLAAPDDRYLPDELSYIRLLKSGKYDTLLADPLLTKLPAARGMTAIPLVHPAVSGKLGWQQVPQYGPDFIRGLLKTLVSKGA